SNVDPVTRPAKATPKDPSLARTSEGRTALEIDGRMKTQGATKATVAKPRGIRGPTDGAPSSSRSDVSCPARPVPPSRVATAAATIDVTRTAACTAYGSCIGQGSHCARTPVRSGPPPNPLESATAARRGPVPEAALPARSCTHAVPALKVAPAPRPTP